MGQGQSYGFVLGSFVIGLQSGMTRTLLLPTKTFESGKYIEKRLADASVSAVGSERAANRVNVSIHTAKPEWLLVKVVQKLKHFVKNLTN